MADSLQSQASHLNASFFGLWGPSRTDGSSAHNRQSAVVQASELSANFFCMSGASGASSVCQELRSVSRALLLSVVSFFCLSVRSFFCLSGASSTWLFAEPRCKPTSDGSGNNYPALSHLWLVNEPVKRDIQKCCKLN